jgi:quercetin dioxygenase-like cupin family protein
MDVQLHGAGVIAGDDYEVVRYPSDEIRLRVVDRGDVQVTEYLSTDREGGPPHRHSWHEIEYVIEGTVEFFIGGDWHRAGPGSVQVLPAGEVHNVRVPEGEARLLMVTIGPPYDGFARDLAAGPEDVVATAARWGVTLG